MAFSYDATLINNSFKVEEGNRGAADENQWQVFMTWWLPLGPIASRWVLPCTPFLKSHMIIVMIAAIKLIRDWFN